MASFTSSIARPSVLLKPSIAAISTKPIYGLPRMSKRSSGVKFSMETKQPKKEQISTAGASAAAVMLTVVMSSSPAMALVDDRMSTEGTGLPFGLSNNLLGWILFGVFGLIWALYFTYTSSLDEDEDSGLSL
uniref:PSII 6.1 kDa protein n=1 Tax=Noccaea caerulescens TaxID=107243 RepID=A0A1J3JJX3_NOCCA